MLKQRIIIFNQNFCRTYVPSNIIFLRKVWISNTMCNYCIDFLLNIKFQVCVNKCWFNILYFMGLFKKLCKSKIYRTENTYLVSSFRRLSRFNQHKIVHETIVEQSFSDRKKQVYQKNRKIKEKKKLIFTIVRYYKILYEMSNRNL